MKREVVEFLKLSLGHSNRRSCSLVGLWRSTQRYKPKDPHKDDAVKLRMRELVNDNSKIGCPMIHDILKREGLVINPKRTERIYYREEKLSLRRRPRRRRASHSRLKLPDVSRPNERWAMDFIQDSLWSGRRFRTLSNVDTYTRECMTVEADTSLPGFRVFRILERLADLKGLPDSIRVDTGPEFISKVLDEWSYRNGVKLDFIRPGKPVENAYVESFLGKFRDECLNENYFSDIHEAKTKIEE